MELPGALAAFRIKTNLATFVTAKCFSAEWSSADSFYNFKRLKWLMRRLAIILWLEGRRTAVCYFLNMSFTVANRFLHVYYFLNTVIIIRWRK